MTSTKVTLDLRGRRISLEREALMELPESVLLCLFPNGVVLSPQRQARQDGDSADEGEDVYYVEVSRDSVNNCVAVLLCLSTQGPPL